MSDSSPPRVLAVVPRVIPSTVIGVIKPLTALHRQKRIALDLTLEYLVSRRQVASADVVVFCRNVEAAHGNALQWARDLGKPIIYELDDDLLDLPANVEMLESHRDPARADQLRAYLASAQLVRVYSEHLRRKISALNAHIARVEGPVDWRLVPDKLESRADDKIRVVYATSRIVDALADIFLDDAERLLAAFRNRVELVFWGCRPAKLSNHPSVRLLDFVADYDRFFSRFARAGFDIGLAPLPSDDFYLAKSNNKFREYAACRIAGVYSNVPVYSDCVEDGKTGLLVANERGAWYDALARLVQDAGLRSRIQAQAHAFARARYDQDRFCDVWLEQINAVRTQTSYATIERAARVSQSNERANPFLKIATGLPRLAARFAHSIRARGARQSLEMARWTLNDLSILSWKWRGRG